MEPLLNKIIVIFFTLLTVGALGQGRDDFNEKDYKDKQQFDHYWRKRRAVGAWQINQLKKGALVIKLRTNRNLIEQLEKKGQTKLAEEKRLETMVVNKTIMLAFMDNFKFCKLYFINSYSSDTLLNGAKKGIFLDTNLRVDPSIEMNEKFYLIAEKDRVYNSSIGFVPEDSARIVKEHGNPSGYDVLAVVKNKYGHQLKKPFPYMCGYGLNNSGSLNTNFVKNLPVYYFPNESWHYSIIIDKTQLKDIKESTNKQFKKGPAGASVYLLTRVFAYEILSLSVSRFNDELHLYYQANPAPDLERVSENVKRYFY